MTYTELDNMTNGLIYNTIDNANRLDKDLLKQNIKTFLSNTLKIEIKENDLDYICDDLDPHHVSCNLVNYVDSVFLCDDCFCDLIIDMIVKTTENEAIS